MDGRERFDDIDNLNGEKTEYNDWKKYKIWVIDTVRRLRIEVDELRKDIKDEIIPKINSLENKIVALQVKSGVWGLLAGLLGVLIAMLIRSQFGD